MYDLRRGAVSLAVVAILAMAKLGLQTPGPRTARATTASPSALLDASARQGRLKFAPDVAPTDRQVVLAAITRARPEARRLIDNVDGLVTIRVGSVGGTAVGLTRTAGSGFEVILDLGTVYHESGERGVSRLVLHELGHVVDFMLVPAALKSDLDATIPAGYACDPGLPNGACAAREERFAETFAKWATGDLGVDIHLGYKVLAPPSLEAWGRPLAALAVP